MSGMTMTGTSTNSDGDRIETAMAPAIGPADELPTRAAEQEETTMQSDATQSGQTLSVDGDLMVCMTRRRAIALLGAVGATAALSSLLGARPASAASPRFVATTDLNLRAKPRSNAKVLRVIPEGGVVSKIGGGSGRYVKVVYDGTRGYAHLDYLNDAGHHSNQPDDDFTGVAATTTDVNLRSGPGANNTVLRVVAPGQEVQTSTDVRNGYRYVAHQGLAGWMWDEYLGVPNGGDGGSGVRKTTTTAVNHRAEPSTNAYVYAVIPAGTSVFAMGDVRNGFEKVRYDAMTGWVYADYLR